MVPSLYTNSAQGFHFSKSLPILSFSSSSFFSSSSSSFSFFFLITKVTHVHCLQLGKSGLFLISKGGTFTE